MELVNGFLLLLLAHYVADFPLQGDFLGTMKGKYDYLLFAHVVIWSGVISLALVYLGIYTIYKLLFLFIGHFVIDRWKARKENKENALTWDLWIDQSLHVVQLIIVLGW